MTDVAHVGVGERVAVGEVGPAGRLGQGRGRHAQTSGDDKGCCQTLHFFLLWNPNVGLKLAENATADVMWSTRGRRRTIFVQRFIEWRPP